MPSESLMIFFLEGKDKFHILINMYDYFFWLGMLGWFSGHQGDGYLRPFSCRMEVMNV